MWYWVGQAFILLIVIGVVSMVLAYIWEVLIVDEIEYRKWSKRNEQKTSSISDNTLGDLGDQCHIAVLLGGCMELDPLHKRIAEEARERISRMIAGVAGIAEKIDTKAADAVNGDEDEQQKAKRKYRSSCCNTYDIVRVFLNIYVCSIC